MISIIDRCEQKYFLTNDQYVSLLNMLSSKLIKDQYYQETIYNIYFDNDYFELMNQSMDKPYYKEKVRLRSYDLLNNDAPFFLEIKKKCHQHTNKRRIALQYQDYVNYIEKGIIPNADKQIMQEIDYCFKHYRLKPKIKVYYNRLSYCLKDDLQFRITFDNQVYYDFHNLSLLNFTINDDKLLFQEGYIMEIKTFSGIPLWFNKILNLLKIYPVSFSKVGKILEKEGVMINV